VRDKYAFNGNLSAAGIHAGFRIFVPLETRKRHHRNSLAGHDDNDESVENARARDGPSAIIIAYRATRSSSADWARSQAVNAGADSRRSCVAFADWRRNLYTVRVCVCVCTLYYIYKRGGEKNTSRT